ncbi:hypothetical protein DAPPUDRAFT_119384 [Daphnia pulex]|uniref:RRM domain-containing protein n=1 Tax=Daphnia pulex TaxID=6669 RepID=E9HYD2_DAPPU|nr:hypothetical protein DAPPUDRAFT_119384 [Daphnia pulex]|eukprot:EFX63249.1 hypothetical protein DAPPUDRAFT_119384 [Daphnia pulex]
MRVKRYLDRVQRLEFLSFMENVKKEISDLHHEECSLDPGGNGKSYLLEEVPDGVKPSTIYYFWKSFGNLRDLSIAMPNRRKRRGTATIFVEFEKKEDGKRFLEYCGSNQVNLFEAIGIHPAIDTIPPRKREELLKSLSSKTRGSNFDDKSLQQMKKNLFRVRTRLVSAESSISDSVSECAESTATTDGSPPSFQ